MAAVIPCIDLQRGGVVQLVQGQRKALDGPDADEMLRRFEGFPEIQVIDLDAAMGVGENAAVVERLASTARCRVGGGVRSAERAAQLVERGAHRVIVGTAAFQPGFDDIVAAVGPDRVIVALDSKHGQVVVEGWARGVDVAAEDVMSSFAGRCGGFLCTLVDREGMLQGTDLDWFARLRQATTLPITAAGGVTTLDEVRSLLRLDIDVAIGMAVYTGRLALDDLRGL